MSSVTTTTCLPSASGFSALTVALTTSLDFFWACTPPTRITSARNDASMGVRFIAEASGLGAIFFPRGFPRRYHRQGEAPGPRALYRLGRTDREVPCGSIAREVRPHDQAQLGVNIGHVGVL